MRENDRKHQCVYLPGTLFLIGGYITVLKFPTKCLDHYELPSWQTNGSLLKAACRP